MLILLLAACGGRDDNQPLPTIMSLSLDGTPPHTATAAPSMPGAADNSASSRETLPPTWTITATPTLTETLTVTPSLTITDTQTPTPTMTPSETPEPNAISLLAQLALNATVLPPTYYPAIPTLTPPGVVVVQPDTVIATPTTSGGSACRYLPPGGFGLVVSNDPILAGQIGCPFGDPPITASLSSAYQPFERGAMLWINDIIAHIYVLNSDGTFQRFDDTYTAGVDPESGGLAPPPGLVEPVRGFGKVWRDNPHVQTNLGWATALESGSTTTSQEFTQGRMLYIAGRGDIWVLIYSSGVHTAGTWRAVPGQF